MESFAVEHIIGSDRLQMVENDRRKKMGALAYYKDYVRRVVQYVLGQSDDHVFRCQNLEELKPYLTEQEYSVWEEREMMQWLSVPPDHIMLFSYDVDQNGEVRCNVTQIRTFDRVFRKKDE